MTNNLYDPAAMLEAERLTLENLPDSALFHRAWCDPNECYLTPAATPLNAPAAAIHQKTFTATFAGETFRAILTQYIASEASELEKEPTIHFEADGGGEIAACIIPALADQWNAALCSTIPEGARGALDPLDYIADEIKQAAKMQR